jgi:hypothetical protein
MNARVSSGSGVEDQLARECGQVATAVAFVARQPGSRVVVAGLRFGEQLLTVCASLAAGSGVVLEPLWWPDDAGCDLLVRTADRSPGS